MYITHYYPEDSPIFSRITQYTKKERMEIANILASKEGSALTRFRDFERYYQKRIQTEKWLYAEAKNIKLSPSVQSPWYFVLGDNYLMNKGFGINSKAFRINLSDINDSDISFTIGDSIAVYFSEKIKNKLYNKKTILNYYSNNFDKIEKIYSYLHPKHQYIEAQLWTDIYF